MDFKLNISTLKEENKLSIPDKKKIYDVIIIGGGPAGLTASVYCMRKGLSTALITKGIGGQVAETAGIENYMGYRFIEGIELVEKFKAQIKQFELAFQEGISVVNIKNNKIKEVVLENQETYKSKTIIIASGKSPRKLKVPGENEFIGKGVAYCSICDAPFYKDLEVVVTGGGNSAIEAALDLVKIAKKVTIIQNLEKLTADSILINKLEKYNNFDILYNSLIKKIEGDKKVISVIINDVKTNEEKTINTDGIFVEIGLIPNTGFAKDILKLNKYNEIMIDCQCNTNIPGIFAAGDATSVKFKQIIIAGGEGAKAALNAYEYLLMKKN